MVLCCISDMYLWCTISLFMYRAVFKMSSWFHPLLGVFLATLDPHFCFFMTRKRTILRKVGGETADTLNSWTEQLWQGFLYGLVMLALSPRGIFGWAGVQETDSTFLCASPCFLSRSYWTIYPDYTGPPSLIRTLGVLLPSKLSPQWDACSSLLFHWKTTVRPGPWHEGIRFIW